MKKALRRMKQRKGARWLSYVESLQREIEKWQSPENFHPIIPFLECSVPLRIMELKRRGGPSERDFEITREFAWILGSYGDRLMYRTPNPKDGYSTARVANELAQSIAVLSFVPGGVRLFGNHWRSGE